MSKHNWWQEPARVMVDKIFEELADRVKDYMNPQLLPHKDLIEGAFAPVEWKADDAALVSVVRFGKRVEMAVVIEAAQVTIYGLTATQWVTVPANARLLMSARNRETRSGTWGTVPVNGVHWLRCARTLALTGLTSSELSQAATEVAQEVGGYEDMFSM